MYFLNNFAFQCCGFCLFFGHGVKNAPLTLLHKWIIDVVIHKPILAHPKGSSVSWFDRQASVVRRRCRRRPHSSNVFFSETTGPIRVKIEPPWDGVTTIWSNDPGNMTKMAAMSIYGKIFKNFFFGTDWPMLFETWHIASDNRVLPRLLKWWPWSFYGKLKFCLLRVCMGKG